MIQNNLKQSRNCIKNKSHPYCLKDGRILKYRLIMEKKIGRFLKPEEVVHHLDHNCLNNDPDNLVLFPNKAAHQKYHHFLRKIVVEELLNDSFKERRKLMNQKCSKRYYLLNKNKIKEMLLNYYYNNQEEVLKRKRDFNKRKAEKEGRVYVAKGRRKCKAI